MQVWKVFYPSKGFFFLFLTLVLSLSGQAELTFSLSPTLTKNIFNAWALLNGGKGVLAHSHWFSSFYITTPKVERVVLCAFNATQKVFVGHQNHFKEEKKRGYIFTWLGVLIYAWHCRLIKLTWALRQMAHVLTMSPPFCSRYPLCISFD